MKNYLQLLALTSVSESVRWPHRLPNARHAFSNSATIGYSVGGREPARRRRAIEFLSEETSFPLIWRWTASSVEVGEREKICVEPILMG